MSDATLTCGCGHPHIAGDEGEDCGCKVCSCTTWHEAESLDHEVEGEVPAQWWLDLKLENQRLREVLQAIACAADDHSDLPAMQHIYDLATHV